MTMLANAITETILCACSASGTNARSRPIANRDIHPGRMRFGRVPPPRSAACWNASRPDDATNNKQITNGRVRVWHKLLRVRRN